MTHNYKLQHQQPTVMPLEVIQGDYFQFLAFWMVKNTLTNEMIPKDLEGWTGRMQIRTAPGGDIIADLSTDNARILLPEQGQDQVVEWEGSGIYIFSDTTKQWNIWTRAPGTDTQAWTPGIHAYDYKLVPPGGPAGQITIYEGPFCVQETVTT